MVGIEVDAARREAWNRWAKAIARREAQRVQMDTAPEIAAAIRHKVDPLVARLDALERRVRAMEAMRVGKVLEWPLPKDRAA